MGCSCPTFCEERLPRPGVAEAEPSVLPCPRVKKGSRDPAPGILPMTCSGGVLVSATALVPPVGRRRAYQPRVFITADEIEQIHKEVPSSSASRPSPMIEEPWPELVHNLPPKRLQG
jgi:hypothetical protein